MNSLPSVWLHRFALLTAAATLFLLFVGGMVTTTDSGDAVPDWWFVPVSYGKLLPPMVGGIFYEHGHRLVATGVGLMTIILAVWLKMSEPRGWLRKLGFAALIAVVAQGILGGLRVLIGGSDQALRPIFSITHACLAQGFFCLAVAITLFTSNSWRADVSKAAKPSLVFLLASATTFALFLQLVLGAVMRHTGSGLLFHLGLAGVVSLMAITTVIWISSTHPGYLKLNRPALAMGLLLLVQVGLGLGTYYFLKNGFERSSSVAWIPAIVITGHLAVGALLLAASLVVTLESYRLLPSVQRPSAILAFPDHAG